jgi:hypothetical protein
MAYGTVWVFSHRMYKMYLILLKSPLFILREPQSLP